ncbi:MAG: asparaginase [Candidatus Palauibacterales bacterium]|nr:asparaginase [Candidatus Palauibacterales bacterium]
MSGREAFVEVRRGEVVESRHRVSAALLDEQGQLLAHVGDPELVTYMRSVAKPFQALPLVAEGAAAALKLSDAELAVCSASHSGEPAHVEIVEGLLARIGCSEEDLACGPHAPFHKPSAVALRNGGREPSRVHNNCSGKHAGMLALAQALNADTRGYRRADHPVQIRIRREIAFWTEQRPETMKASIDGCGVMTYTVSISGLAGAYARLVAAADRDSDSPAGQVVRAMTNEPFYVGGSERLATDLIEVTAGRVLAKDGAEGVFCLGDRERRLGLAVKIEDGQTRAVGPAVIEFLAQAGMLSDGELKALDRHRVGVVENSVGEMVGEIRPAFKIKRSE